MVRILRVAFAILYPIENAFSTFQGEPRRAQAEHVFEEKERIGRLSQIRELVLGAQDGLLVPLGVVSSVAGAFSNNGIVIVAGIAEALAGGLSMATGVFLSSQAQRQLHISEIKRENEAIKTYPEDEREELVLMFEREGLARNDAETAVRKIAASPKSFFTTMVQKELGIDPEPPGAPLKDAFYVGASYLVAAFIPIFPYFFMPSQQALVYSILFTLAALFVIGVLKALTAELPIIKSGIQVLLIGALSGIGGYALGAYLPHLLRIK